MRRQLSLKKLELAVSIKNFLRSKFVFRKEGDLKFLVQVMIGLEPVLREFMQRFAQYVLNLPLGFA